MPEKVAFVLKNFPKVSETFIASEIHRLERLGLDIRLFVIKPPTETMRHAVVDEIRAPRTYLPATGSLSETPLRAWLKAHFGDFRESLVKVAKTRPRGVLRAAAFAVGQAWRARRGWRPRKVYLKEFLQATVVAAGIVEDGEVRHIHAHFAHGATTVAWMASMMTGLRFSFTAHAKDIYLESLNPAGLLARKMDAAEFVVTCTDANRKHLEALSATPVHRLYHGLNAEFSQLLKGDARKTPRNGHLRALAVGRLVAKKGLDVFVEACGELARRGVKFEAKIVGEGAGDGFETRLRDMIASRGLEGKVLLPGAMRQDALFGEFLSSDVFCLPCRILENGDRDGIPNVMVEAMSCGVPVVSTNVSGIPEIIDSGRSGLLVEPEDATALADSLERIYRDRQFADDLARNGREKVREEFDGDVSAGKLKALFDGVGRQKSH